MKIQSCRRGSPAYRAGLRAGMELIAINGEPIQDFIDWNFFLSQPEFTVTAASAGETREYPVRNPRMQDPGLDVEEDLYPPERHCRNRCLFCFIDQLPKGMRESMYVKDDDWRYSLMFGNYVSLTNLDEAEFSRLIRRHVSPLYVSIHATNPELRVKLTRNPKAGLIMEQLRALGDAGIEFHGQVVLCPGLNDGEELRRTIRDVMNLRPHAASLAVVPLGMTCHRENLTQLAPMNRDSARAVIAIVEEFQQESLAQTGERFVYCSDEMYGIADYPWPRYGEIEEGSPQWGNGVGMFDLFFEGLEEVWEELPQSLEEPRRVTLVTGMAAAPTMEKVAQALMQRVGNLTVQVKPIVNHFFGETIDVAGLLTGGDIADQLDGMDVGEALLVPDVALKRDEAIFLDDMSVEELSERVHAPVVSVYDEGGDLAFKAIGWEWEEE